MPTDEQKSGIPDVNELIIARLQVYDALTAEFMYSLGWGGAEHDMKWHPADWIVFAEKYLNEAKLAYAGFTPDYRSVYIRMLKAASLLVSGLQYMADTEQLASIAGVSSSKFPILGGLVDFKKAMEQYGFSESDADLAKRPKLSGPPEERK